MAYFGRQLKKPQQRGRLVGGTTKPGQSSRADVTRAVRAVLRPADEERPGRPTRVVRTLRAARAIRAGRASR